MKSSIIKSIAIVCAFLLFTISESAAQRNNNGKGGGKGKGNDKPKGGTTGVPIDGGASVLLVAGAAYGLKKLRDQYRKNNSDITPL